MPIDYAPLISADSEALAVAAAKDMTAPIEHCPGWTMTDLVTHICRVQTFWEQVVRSGSLDRPTSLPPDPPSEPDALLAAAREATRRMLATFAAADPALPVWTWSADHSAGFVQRHQIQEAAVHRWDAQHAVGAAEPIDPAGAADAIGEFFTHSAPAGAAENLGAQLLLHATDTGDTWPLGSGTTTRVEATASDLLLWLYERIELTAADDIVARFRGLCETD